MLGGGGRREWDRECGRGCCWVGGGEGLKSRLPALLGQAGAAARWPGMLAGTACRWPERTSCWPPGRRQELVKELMEGGQE